MLIEVTGDPITFASPSESEWKELLEKLIPSPNSGGKELGVKAAFRLAPGRRPLDVDNLCEPLFSVLIGRRGWFGGRRPNVQWWEASKSQSDSPGCTVEISSELGPTLPYDEPIWDATYAGPLPTSARDGLLAQWALGLRRHHDGSAMPESFHVHLVFGSPAVNIAEIPTGPVKSFIDCLYPLIGGAMGAPEDHRIEHLSVEKGVPGVDLGSVRLRIWSSDVVATVAPPVPEITATRSTTTMTPSSPDSGTLNNPCRPGTAKFIVCDAAIARRSITETIRELNRLRPDAGSRIKAYIYDLKSENGLDIQIEREFLVLKGKTKIR